MSAAATVVPALSPGSRQRSGWPLVVLFAGWPLWWVLGLAELMPLAVAGVMAAQLLRRRPVAFPRGFGWWVLFLVWVVLGAALLWVDAPGAVPGGDGSRLVVFAFRLAWYAACTVVLVWVTTLPRAELPDRRVHLCVAWIFGVATAGGLLAMAVPTLEWSTPLEALVPPSLRSTGLIRDLVHVEVADIQSVLGTPSGRPKAPFAYTNTWGSVMGLSLVFVLAWLAGLRGARAWRWATVSALVVAAAIPPVLYSLNRGLWGSLALVAVGLLVLAAVKGYRLLLPAAVMVLVVSVGVVLVSPLGEVIVDRLESPHSNDRRGELLTLTARSVTDGSPVLGFGSTRDVQGSFTSIVGGSTPECPACGVPPLGTQGQLWTVLFSQGWVGLGLFAAFLVVALSRSWRCRTVNETLCTLTLAVFALQLPVYDTLGLPFLLVMVAIGLVAREQRETTGPDSPRLLTSSDRFAEELRRGVPLLAGGAVLGLVAGVASLGLAPEPDAQTRVWMVITPAPVYLDPEALLADDEDQQQGLREITIDTEAALMLSQESLSRAARQVGSDPGTLREALTLTGEPNSSVLALHVRWADASEVDVLVESVTESYFETRREYLEARREDLLATLREQRRTLEAAGDSAATTRAQLSETIASVAQTRGEVGEIIRSGAVEDSARPSEVYAMSGTGLGLLAGATALALAAPRPRRRE